METGLLQTEQLSLARDSDANKFLEDVLQGLQSSPKKLYSKYFYDKEGDALFQQIMASPEYYLTRCELEIFSQQTSFIAQKISNKKEAFDLIELGVGDGTKSKYLLQHLLQQNSTFHYYPIDISGNILSELEAGVKKEMPGLQMTPLQGDYFDMLSEATLLSNRQKVVLFLGSNIGNMDGQAARQFCKQLYNHLSPGDLVVMGFDLKKHPQTILDAYNDKGGITARFNLNLLKRINHELKGNFIINQFEHYQCYDPATGACKSYLVSLSNQQVSIGSKIISFYKDECIDMEVSQKFSVVETDELAKAANFKPVHHFFDSRNWFLDALWIAV